MDVSAEQPKTDFTSVVYATDFSPSAENAGVYARLLASQLKAAFFVAHSFRRSQAAIEVELDHKVDSQQRKDLQVIVARKAASLSTESLTAIPALIDGDADHVIAEFADKHAPALIVLGTHGGARVVRRFIGSVAEAILRSTQWPCLTIGPHVPTLAATATKLELRRILCVTDCTVGSVRAVAYARSLAKTLGAEMNFLNIVPDKELGSKDRLDALRNEFHDALDKALPIDPDRVTQPQTFVAAGNAHDRILEHIKTHGIDLLVLGKHAASQIGQDRQTAEAFQIIVDAPCPVLTTPEQR